MALLLRGSLGGFSGNVGSGLRLALGWVSFAINREFFADLALKQGRLARDRAERCIYTSNISRLRWLKSLSCYSTEQGGVST